MRILKWVLDRVHGRTPAQETLLGWVPREHDIDLRDLDLSEEKLTEATRIDLDEWNQELQAQGEFFEQMGKTAPEAMLLQRRLLLSRLPSRHGKS
jgi:phosphoenolpyruvate carboxykinase (GTP)